MLRGDMMRGVGFVVLLAACSDAGWLEQSKMLVDGYDENSSNLHEDPPWSLGMLGPTDIWQATIDLSAL